MPERPDERHVTSVFQEIAQVYDPMNRVLTFGQWQRWQRAFERFTPARPGMRVLDVGCGTGDLTLILARMVGPQGHVIGLDLTPAMLEVARAKVARSGLGARIELVEANALHLPFEDQSFDGVTAGFSLRNMADLDGALAEMWRVLKPGGFAVSLDVSKPSAPVVRPLFLWFFYRLVPWIGALGGRGRAPYAWLSESLKAFPDRAELTRRLREHGFERVEDRPLSFGAAALHRGFRPPSGDTTQRSEGRA
jgi:demethylmenaquinone methyltransferase/2-methoxy-6-polyprenyl-1,4-benzoquinol methylase